MVEAAAANTSWYFMVARMLVAPIRGFLGGVTCPSAEERTQVLPCADPPLY